MNGSKKFYESKTFWFSVVYAIVSIAGLFGYADFTPSTDVAEIVQLSGAIIMLVLRLMTNKGIEF